MQRSSPRLHFLLLIAPCSVGVAPGPGITGALDGVSPPGAASSAVGWAVDAANTSAPVRLRFYLNAPPPTGVLLGDCFTGSPRPDLGLPGLHGFSFAIPEKYLDKRNHSVLGFGVSSDGVLAPLNLSGAVKSDTFSCGLVSCPTLPISANASGVSVQAVGSAEFVWQHSVDGCAFGDGADSPARAFRDASGNVVLTAANAGSTYRRVGATLDSVKSACASGPIMGSAGSKDYFKLEDLEWPTAPYAINSTHVYALVHNEWHAPETLNPACKTGGAWVNGITIAVSVDGGRRFHHPADYRIRIPPRWRQEFPCNATVGSQFGSFEPSNIVRRKEDGLFYATFNYISAPVGPGWPSRGPVVGDCIIRTADLAKGSAWQVWTGNSTWSGASVTEHCAVINQDASLDIKTLSFNTYLDKFIGVGDRLGRYGFSLSSDLHRWDEFVPFLVDVPQGPSAYISLLDPTDTGQTFEQSGQSPFVYLTLLRTWPNFDIIRQQVMLDAWNASLDEEKEAKSMSM